MSKQINKIVIAISGASGVHLGLKFVAKFLEYNQNAQIFVVISKGAKLVLKREKGNKITLNALQQNTRISFLDDNQLDSSIASGSFGVDSMAIIPCSMNTLAKITYGISDTLITRCASVCLKEKKRLLLAPREMPFSAIALNNMLLLANANVIIAPPVVGYYSHILSLEQMEDFFIGKWFDSLGVANDLYKHWE